MKIIPIKIEYYFEVMSHKMQAEALHLENQRQINYYFDEKLVSQKTLPDGDFLMDDDIIRELVEEYAKNHADVFADMFKNHSDKVLLTAKTVDVIIENYGLDIRAKIREEKDSYKVMLSANDDTDMITGTFRAANFSEVLEKLRMFINTLGGVSEELSQHIDEFANDKVLERIQWQ